MWIVFFCLLCDERCCVVVVGVLGIEDVDEYWFVGEVFVVD